MERQGIFRPNSTWQTHHLIPEEVWKSHKNFFNRIGMKGRDSYPNGLYMPSDNDEATKCKRKFYHRGSHDNYSALIEKRIQRLEDKLDKGLITQQEAFDSVQRLQKVAKRFLSMTSKNPMRLN
nr:AHH domain-containing protein [Eikenella corrodens]